MSQFRPSSVVRFILRTEEFTDTEGLDSRVEDVNIDAETVTAARPLAVSGVTPPNTPAERIEGINEALRDLQRRRDGLSEEAFQAELAELVGQLNAAVRGEPLEEEPPEAVSGASNDGLTVLATMIPRNVSVERNGLTSADTCSITLDAEDGFAFDPRVLRSCAVEVVVSIVPEDDFEAGVERQERRADGSLLSVASVQPDASVSGFSRFVGVVDDWALQYNENGNEVQLECRDISAIPRDLQLLPGESIDLSLRIDEGVRDFLERHPATRGINVIYRGDGVAPTPTSLIRERQPRRGRRRRRVRRGNQKMSRWDHITDVVLQLGLVVYIDGFDVIINDARTLFSREGVRRMVYGRNLSELSFSRRLGGVKTPTIEVRSLDTDIGRTRWARFPVPDGARRSGILGETNPDPPRRANNVTPSGTNPTEEIRTLNVSGIRDPAALERYAENAFNEIGRQEIEGTFKTDDASSFQVPQQAGDLLSLVAGDPVEILIAQFDPNDRVGPETSLAVLQAYSRERRAEYLRSVGFADDVAERFAALQDEVAYQTVFRVVDSRVEWDIDDGLSVSVDFQNYITLREEASASTVEVDVGEIEIGGVTAEIGEIEVSLSGEGLPSVPESPPIVNVEVGIGEIVVSGEPDA